MQPGELMMSGSRVRQYLGELRGGKRLHLHTLQRAIRERKLPWHPDPFGTDRMVFYRSEVDAWLASFGSPEVPAPAAPARRRGRPVKGVRA